MLSTETSGRRDSAAQIARSDAGDASRVMASSVTFYVVMTVISLVFLLPLVWMVLSSFKTQEEIFANPWALPKSIDLSILGRGLAGGRPRHVRHQQHRS